MPATPTYALRYPAATDPADVPADMQKLATDTEAAITGATIPKPVVNGQWIKGAGGAAVWSPISFADVTGQIVDAQMRASIQSRAAYPPGQDCNNATQNGWYWLDTSCVNRPAGIVNAGEMQVVGNDFYPYIQQFVYDYNGLATYRRFKGTGAWSAWAQVWPANLTQLDDTARMPQAGSAALCWIKYAGAYITTSWGTIFQITFPATTGSSIVVDFFGGTTNNYEGTGMVQTGGPYTIRFTSGLGAGQNTTLGSNTISWNWYPIGGGVYNFNAIVVAGPSGAQFSGMWIVKAMGY